MTTEVVYLESSRATAAPMQPEPMMATSYVPSALAAEWRVRERGHGVSTSRSLEPPAMLNLSACGGVGGAGWQAERQAAFA